MKSPIEQMLDQVDWSETTAKPSQEGLPYATHSGVLEIGDLKLRCYRLNDGRAVFNAEDVDKFFR